MAKFTITMAGTGNTKNRISLQTEVVLTLKTIATVAITIIGIFWGFHEWVLDKRLSTIESEINAVEGKIDKVYDHMIGIGGTTNNEIEKAEHPVEENTTKGQL